MFRFLKRKEQSISDQLLDAKRKTIDRKNAIADMILSRGSFIERRTRQVPVEFDRRKVA